MSQRGGSAELVECLISLKADVDSQYDLKSLSRVGRVFIAAKSLQHRFGRGTLLTALALSRTRSDAADGGSAVGTV